MINKITWTQFESNCNNEHGKRIEFENLCRQIVIEEFLSTNKNKVYIHCNHNNPGIESDPIYDEKNNRFIGFQAKYFDSRIAYNDILNSAKQTIKHYSGKVNHIYLFCNKSIDVQTKSFKNIRDLLDKNNISIQVISDNTILDIVRKHEKMALYYFNQYSINYDWLSNHNNEIIRKLGQRYNNELNVDTTTSLKLSLFTHDHIAVEYLNNKKYEMITKIKELLDCNLFDQDIAEILDSIIAIILKIDNVSVNTINDVLNWNEILQSNTQLAFEIIQERINNLIIEENELLKKNKNPERLYSINKEVKKLKDVIELLNNDFISKSEIDLLTGKILFIEGNAGVGKSHMIANESIIINNENRYSLLLMGSDYLDNSYIQEQIAQGLCIDYSFEELIDILDYWGGQNNCVVPLFIDAINESYNINVWKNGLPKIMDKVINNNYIRLIISFRNEYKNNIINEENLKYYHVIERQHQGFTTNTMEAVQKFLNHYNIPFTPLDIFNQNITNPLFLTLYCRTYDGNEVNFPALYEKVLKYANENIYNNLENTLKNVGYGFNDDFITQIINSVAGFMLENGRKSIQYKDMTRLPIWKELDIRPRLMIRELINENIFVDYPHNDDKIIFFAFDQMYDYYCAKAIIDKYNNKIDLQNYLINEILEVDDGHVNNYVNKELFINACMLYADKFKEECINIIDVVKDDIDRSDIFDSYIDSFQWRTCVYLSLDELIDLFCKYQPSADTVWNMFISNSIKTNHPFNAYALNDILMKYSLINRDYYWTIYINSFTDDSDDRLVQLIKMYNSGQSIEFKSSCQIELLLILLGWCLTSSNRWFRDVTSKAMIEILKSNFSYCEIILKRFQNVDDPYIIQRLYGIILGACLKRTSENKKIFTSLVHFIYESIFNKSKVYPDILLRDYARLIIERFLYEYPNEISIEHKKIIPPYTSDDIPDTLEFNYDKKGYIKGSHAIISSMTFDRIDEGMYGDFGRYVYQGAVSEFDVDLKKVFKYSIYYIFNILGYSDDLFTEYDRRNIRVHRHGEYKVERIGKKYQWITMYHMLARIADNYPMKNRDSSEKGIYTGSWSIGARDFDPTLNENFLINKGAPQFNIVNEHIEFLKTNNSKNTFLTNLNESNWLSHQSPFFDYLKEDLILEDNNKDEWVVLYKYIDTGRNKLLCRSNVYGYFVNKEQKRILKDYAKTKKDFLMSDILSFPSTYEIFNREFPWSPSMTYLDDITLERMELNTGQTKTFTEHYDGPCFINDLPGGDYNDFIPKNSEYTREEPILEDIGTVIPTTINMVWEGEYDASKRDTISFHIPCADILKTLKLSQKEYDGYFYDSYGNLASFDTSLTNQQAGIIIRKDLLDEYLNEKDMNLIWIIDGSKEIHGDDRFIEKFSDWRGLWFYEGNLIFGDVYKKD